MGLLQKKDWIILVFQLENHPYGSKCSQSGPELPAGWGILVRKKH